jgi:hypothetical protein
MKIKVYFNKTESIKNLVKDSYERDVLKLLSSRGSIGKLMNYEFIKTTINDDSVDLLITWCSDDDILEGNYRLNGYSMAIMNSRNPGKIYLNIFNWKSLREPHHSAWINEYGREKALKKYRKYVVNHEFGHVLGAGHDDFVVSKKKKYCHLMEQQTFTPKRICKPSYKIHSKTKKILNKLK